MDRFRLITILLILVTLLLGNVVLTQARVDWATLKTDYFTVFYQPDHELEAWQLLQTLEHYRPWAEQIGGNRRLRLAVVIDDTGALVNGYSDPLGNNAHLYRYPPAEWAGTENWWALVGFHEYLHHLTLSNSSGWPGLNRRLFGESILTLPNLANPGWIVEGVTVYGESQLSPYQGRLNDGRFDAYIAARAAAGAPVAITDATHETNEFHLNGIYTYGGPFFNYLSRTYGEAKFGVFFKTCGSTYGLFSPFPAQGIDSGARQVFGKTFPQLWKEWWDYEGKRFANYQMEGVKVTNLGWYVEHPVINGSKLYYARRYPVKTGVYSDFSFNEIIERDLPSGRERKVVAATTAFSAPHRIVNGKLYYAVQERRAGYANAANLSFGYYSVLHQLDLATGADRRVLAKSLRTYAVLPDGTILYAQDRPDGFGTRICSYAPRGGVTKTLLDTDYLIAEIVTDGVRLIASARRDWHSLSLYQVDLTEQKLTPLVDTPYLEMDPSLQGDRLYFTANYGRMLSSYCYDLKTAQVLRLTQNGYAAMPVCDTARRELYFIGLGVAGFDLYRKPLQFTDWQLPAAPPAAVPNLENSKLRITKGGYADNLKTLVPRYWFPILTTEGGVTQCGVTTGGGDAIGDFPAYNAAVYYNTEWRRWGGSFNLNCNYWAPLQAGLRFENPADAADAAWNLDLIYPVRNQLSAGLATIVCGARIASDPDYQGPELGTVLQLGLQYPKTQLSLKLAPAFSRLKAGGRRVAFDSSLGWRQYLPGSELNVSVRQLHDPDNPDSVFPKIRGYDAGLGAKSGRIYAVEYERPVWKIHRGCWNPNFYFEDLVAQVFYERADAADAGRQTAYGLELHLETKVHPASIPLDWGVRYVRNAQMEVRYDLLVRLVL